MIIRTATTIDIPAIRFMAQKVWPITYVPIIGEQQVAYMLDLFYSDGALQRQMAEGQQFLISEDEGVITGFASFTCIDATTAKLNKLYIGPDRQGKKTGTRLLEEVKLRACKLGIHTLLVNVNIHNHIAIVFYRMRGFIFVKKEDIDIGGGYFMNDDVYRLPLQA